MLVGEIGIERKEYLYDLDYWEILLITRGYFCRSHSNWEQARLIAYHVRYCMGLGKNETAKDIDKWLPFGWEQAAPKEISQDEQDEMLAEIEALNQMNQNTE
jgi:hypothetical protein